MADAATVQVATVQVAIVQVKEPPVHESAHRAPRHLCPGSFAAARTLAGIPFHAARTANIRTG